jgi:hypothetical protein
MSSSVMVTSAEIDNASSRMKTVFELEKPVTSHEVYNRCMRHLNEVCRDIEEDVLRTWPSRAGGSLSSSCHVATAGNCSPSMGLKSAKNDALLPRGNRARKAFINSIMSQIPGSVFLRKGEPKARRISVCCHVATDQQIGSPRCRKFE